MKDFYVTLSALLRITENRHKFMAGLIKMIAMLFQQTRTSHNTVASPTNSADSPSEEKQYTFSVLDSAENVIQAVPYRVLYTVVSFVAGFVPHLRVVIFLYFSFHSLRVTATTLTNNYFFSEYL